MTSHQVIKIISGGQTGADQGGLEAAEELGIETGGTAARSYMTENGPNLDLKYKFNLHEENFSTSLARSYQERTRRNVEYSEATVIFADIPASSGTKLTINSCIGFGKSFLLNPDAFELRHWLIRHKVSLLNIAGNRESKAPGIQEKTEKILIKALKEPDTIPEIIQLLEESESPFYKGMEALRALAL